MIERGVNINEPGPDGTTPLCAASLWGLEDMVKLLLNNQADVNATSQGHSLP